MGYQETYIYPKNQNEFDKFLSVFKKYEEECWGAGVFPVCIVTFKQDHEMFNKGDKAVYCKGERYYQTRLEDEIILEFKDKINVVFTEDVDPVGIWLDSTPDENYIVIHSPFN